MRGQRQEEGQVDAPMACDESNDQRPKRKSRLPDCQQLCQQAVGCNDVTTLQTLASRFLSTISADVESCLSRKKGPRATNRLCSLVKSFLIHLHMKPAHLKAFTGPLYEDMVAYMLSYYIDLMFEVSNFNGSVPFISNIVTAVNLTLGHSPRHVVETLLELKKDPQAKWDELFPLLKRTLADPASISRTPSEFMKTLVLIKQWMGYGSAKHHRRILKLSTNLTPPPGLEDWLSGHGFAHVSIGLQNSTMSAVEFLLSDQLTPKTCRRLLDVLCSMECSSRLEPTTPTVAHAPKGSDPSPCFFVLDTQPDAQNLMGNDVPTGDDNCEQLYRALDSTIEAMDLDASWRFGLGDGDADDDDLVPLQFHLENSLEQNGFDVTPPKKSPHGDSPEQGKVDTYFETKDVTTVIANVPSKDLLTPRAVARSRRKSSVPRRSGELNYKSPEAANVKSSLQQTTPRSNRKVDISSARKKSNSSALDSNEHHAGLRSGDLDPSKFSTDHPLVPVPEDVARTLFPSKRNDRKQRGSNASIVSNEADSVAVVDIATSNKDGRDKKGNRREGDIPLESASLSRSPHRRKVSEELPQKVVTVSPKSANRNPSRHRQKSDDSASVDQNVNLLPAAETRKSLLRSPSLRRQKSKSSINSDESEVDILKRSVTRSLADKRKSKSCDEGSDSVSSNKKTREIRRTSQISASPSTPDKCTTRNPTRLKTNLGSPRRNLSTLSDSSFNVMAKRSCDSSSLDSAKKLKRTKASASPERGAGHLYSGSEESRTSSASSLVRKKRKGILTDSSGDPESSSKPQITHPVTSSSTRRVRGTWLRLSSEDDEPLSHRLATLSPMKVKNLEANSNLQKNNTPSSSLVEQHSARKRLKHPSTSPTSLEDDTSLSSCLAPRSAQKRLQLITSSSEDDASLARRLTTLSSPKVKPSAVNTSLPCSPRQANTRGAKQKEPFSSKDDKGANRKRLDNQKGLDSSLLVKSGTRWRRDKSEQTLSEPPRRRRNTSKESSERTPKTSPGRRNKAQKHSKSAPPKVISNFSLRQKYRLRSRRQLKG